MNKFYVYLFMREDLFSPYYVGKGSGENRCYWRHGKTDIKCPDKSRIIKIKENLTEEEKFRTGKGSNKVLGEKRLGNRSLTQQNRRGRQPSSKRLVEDKLSGKE